jgi:two-component system osmolarity sensor histidine kinase EnvZ
MEIELISDRMLSSEIRLDQYQAKSQFGDYFLMNIQELSEYDLEQLKAKQNDNQVLVSLKNELSTRIKHKFFVIEQDNETVDVMISTSEKVIHFNFPIHRITTSRNHIFLGWQIISSFILILIAYLFLKNQVKPISNLAKAAEQFGKGQEVNNFKVSGALEVRQASLEFLKMKNRISRQIEQRSLMLAGVSHDLKTPLTRMKLLLESIKDNKIKNELNLEINQMNEMLVEYLDFAAINESKDKSTINPIEAIINIKNDIHFTKHEINLEIINDEEVFVNENIFSRSITNILNNAIVQSDKIIIKADINKNLIKINIHDNGIGIPDSEKDNVFKPFYRVDQSRNQNVSNSGLGLATTKSLLNSINGKISLHDSYLGGLEVAIEIPN